MIFIKEKLNKNKHNYKNFNNLFQKKLNLVQNIRQNYHSFLDKLGNNFKEQIIKNKEV